MLVYIVALLNWKIASESVSEYGSREEEVNGMGTKTKRPYLMLMSK